MPLYQEVNARLASILMQTLRQLLQIRLPAENGYPLMELEVDV